MNSLPSILVIIVTWNKKEYVTDLLDSLLKLSYPQEHIDIVVVDNASSDGTVDLLNEQYKHIHLIANTENLGGCGGFNTGLAWAFEQPEDKYDYLWLLDNDVQVHKDALKELVTLLRNNSDVAIAGSTMMQLTYPWRINEMGAHVDRKRGRLLLNRHREDVDDFREKPLEELLGAEIDLSRHLKDCSPWKKVDYVAAASLLIRAPVAKEAGLWEDFFIHFDDVEWCLRIAEMGHGIAVSARSIIWHLPAENKEPTWILYYDNRNVLYLLEKHGGAVAVRDTRRWILKKCVYYALLGKQDLSRLILQAIQDFDERKFGKKEIVLDDCYQDVATVESIINQAHIKRILLPWTIDLQECGLEEIVSRVMMERSDLQVDYLLPATFMKESSKEPLSGAVSLSMPDGKIARIVKYCFLRGRYDLVFQSDYRPILPLSWVGKQLLFVNYEGISVRAVPRIIDLLQYMKKVFRYR